MKRPASEPAWVPHAGDFQLYAYIFPLFCTQSAEVCDDPLYIKCLARLLKCDRYLPAKPGCAQAAGVLFEMVARNELFHVADDPSPFSSFLGGVTNACF